MTFAPRLILCLGVIFAAIGAEAQTWRIDPGLSSLAIIFKIDDRDRVGAFDVFSGEAEFRTDALEDAEMFLDVTTASIDVGEPFGTEFVKSIDWLFVDLHPTARYRLKRMERIEGDRFRALGELTLRGATSEVEGEITVSFDGAQAEATGETRFNRKDFGVGVGFSTLFVEIDPEITVAFDLVARRVE